jgi:hypothetical protein
MQGVNVLSAPGEPGLAPQRSIAPVQVPSVKPTQPHFWSMRPARIAPQATGPEVVRPIRQTRSPRSERPAALAPLPAGKGRPLSDSAKPFPWERPFGIPRLVKPEVASNAPKKEKSRKPSRPEPLPGLQGEEQSDAPVICEQGKDAQASACDAQTQPVVEAQPEAVMEGREIANEPDPMAVVAEVVHETAEEIVAQVN